MSGTEGDRGSGSQQVWLRRRFEAVGLTQYPVGKHLASIQQQLGGAVVLCLDVSGSMYGTPLAQAVAGSHRFVAEALSMGYEVAVVLWHSDVADHTRLSRESRPLDRLLAAARAGGGNDIVPTLRLADRLLEGRGGDRVVAIFGDGDLGDPRAAAQAADVLRAKNIRIITCGLGDASARALDEISTEDRSAPRTAAADTISDAVAGLVTSLRRNPGS